jgi:UDP-3-O-[3-hydroxymyristoyl] glucosamine N-acyltransferase
VVWTLDEIAAQVKGKVHGDGSHQIEKVATLKKAEKSDISFLSNTKYKKFLENSRAGAVLVDIDSVSLVETNAIVVDDPYVAYAKVATLLFPRDKVIPGVHPTAWISPDSHCHNSASIGAHVFVDAGVEIAENVEIGPGCVIQQGVKIASGTRLTANITICTQVVIGKNVIIHPGVVIGADGFGIANDKGKWIKVPQLGSVEIGDDVEIGANTTIDRGALDNTIIATGVKLDNQIQIAHNVTIGEHTVIAGSAGVAGSTQIGKHCAIGGGTCINGHLTIADGVQITGMSMVTKSIKESGSYSSGIPAEPTQQWHKNVIRYRTMKKLEDRVKRLEALSKE